MEDDMPIIFKKKLSQTDVDHRLTWNANQLEFLRRVCGIDLNQQPHVLPTGEESSLNFKVCDMHNIIWEFGLTTRKINVNNSHYHPKPVISRGWTRFVNEYQLGVGDEIIFYKNVDPRPSTDEMQQVPFTISVNRVPRP